MRACNGLGVTIFALPIKGLLIFHCSPFFLLQKANLKSGRNFLTFRTNFPTLFAKGGGAGFLFYPTSSALPVFSRGEWNWETTEIHVEGGLSRR